jgi:hypothetical protein
MGVGAIRETLLQAGRVAGIAIDATAFHRQALIYYSFFIQPNKQTNRNKMQFNPSRYQAVATNGASEKTAARRSQSIIATVGLTLALSAACLLTTFLGCQIFSHVHFDRESLLSHAQSDGIMTMSGDNMVTVHAPQGLLVPLDKLAFSVKKAVVGYAVSLPLGDDSKPMSVHVSDEQVFRMGTGSVHWRLPLSSTIHLSDAEISALRKECDANNGVVSASVEMKVWELGYSGHVVTPEWWSSMMPTDDAVEHNFKITCNLPTINKPVEKPAVKSVVAADPKAIEPKAIDRNVKPVDQQKPVVANEAATALKPATQQKAIPVANELKRDASVVKSAQKNWDKLMHEIDASLVREAEDQVMHM